MTTITSKQFFGSAARILKTPKPIIKGLWNLQQSKPERFMSIGLLLENQAEKFPDLIAIHFKDEKISYQQLNQRVNRYANYLNMYGVNAGDSIAIMLDNRPETIILALAVVKLGAVASMINTTQRHSILQHSLQTVNTKILIADEIYISAVNDVKPALSQELQDNIFYIPALTTPAEPTAFRDLSALINSSATTNPVTTANIQMKQSAFYIFTSGTTGLPKAARMSHQRWFKSMSGMGMASLRLSSEDVLYLSLPLYHNNALTVSLSAVLGNAATLALAEKFSTSRFWDDIRHYGATAFTYIGELCRYLLNAPKQSSDLDNQVDKIIGNGLRPEIWDEFQQRFGIEHINEFYGASECNLVFTNALNIPHTAGVSPLAFTVVEYDVDNELPVINDNGQMIRVKKGDVGLLLTKITKRSPFDGYTDDNESNKKLFRSVFKKDDCYFNTGDLVRYQGYRHITFVDRLGDTFRWKGENVATTQVEAQINDFEQIEQSVVYGVEIPHADGRAGMAALTLNCVIEDFNLDAFRQHIETRLPSYAQPIFLRLREQQEITGTFKYIKSTLKKEAYLPNSVAEPVWVKLPTDKSYTAMTADIIQDIENQNITL